MCDQSARDDAIVLAALPATRFDLWMTQGLSWNAIDDTLLRLEAANLACYVRATKRWEEMK